jgi:uncharacterized protein YbjT (DUF2867 family)
MSKILVVGANGTVGSHLVSELTKAGQQVLKATSKKAQKPDEVHLNLLTQEGLDQAVTQADKIFLLSPPGHTNQHEILIPIIKKAQEKKIKKIVLMTAMGADAVDEAPFRQAEKYLEKSGLAYNIIRPNWFMQNFNSFWLQGILQDQKIYLPVADGRGSFIDARDIAATAAKLLMTNQFDNQAFVLTGSESLNHDEVAVIMSEILKKKITYQDISEESMREGLLKAGLPKDYTEFLLMILNYFKLGYSAAITDNVEKITGRKPIRFSQYVIDHKDFWLKK